MPWDLGGTYIFRATAAVLEDLEMTGLALVLVHAEHVPCPRAAFQAYTQTVPRFPKIRHIS